VAILFGLLASITYGVADFLGGVVSRRNSTLTVVLISQLGGTLLLLAALPFFLDYPYRGADVGWGAAAGLTGAAGVTLLYRGLASGRMSVVAPITGTVAAAIPVVVGLASGERPSALQLTGVVAAIAAVALVSSGAEDATTVEAGSQPTRIGVPEGLGAGICFGLFFVLLENAGNGSGLWPLVGARASSLTAISIAAVFAHTKLRPAPGTRTGIIGAGVLDVTANLFYLLATRRGLLAIAAALTSMYPATTIVLARVVVKERLQRLQLVGFLCAGAGVVLITLG
jgi:drug/metabolite transporter (DMT)-like permease